MRLSKEQSRKRWAGLRGRVNEWDPVGLIELGAPEDEYECLVGTIMRMLEGGAPAKVIAEFLNSEIPDHFGTEAPNGIENFAAEISQWFSTEWEGTTS